eukprot:3089786-Alexandrium_andersonii.AAC.1
MLAAFREVVAKLRKAKPPVAPDVQSPFPPDLSDEATWERLAAAADAWRTSHTTAVAPTEE